jgi:DNA-binding response OmpR family regulator
VLIVVADKDPYELQALQAALSAPDREILILEDGENIITLVKSRAPDAVVVGASLGQMGGLAVARELKMLADSGAIAATKVIVLLEREADAWIAKWSRCDAWLTKPVEAADVDEKVRELLGQPV